MKKQSTKADYVKRLNIVTDYVDLHLDEKLELNRMAELASLSVFHFHRVARAILKQPFGEYVTRLRVEAAAKLLRYSNKSISEVAYSVGFEVPSSLSKRFKQYYGISPKQYRENLELYIVSPLNRNSEKSIAPEKIVQLQDQSIAYIRMTGEFAKMDFSGAGKALMEFARKHQLFHPHMKSIGICYDDPHITESNYCRYDMGITVNKDFRPEGRIGKKKLLGGKYAVFVHEGPYQTLDQSYDLIYGKWLFEANAELRNAPGFEVFLKRADNTPSGQLLTHIYIPIEA